MGRWFFGCPAYQSGPGKDGFRIDISMASQSSFSRSVPAASRSRNKLRCLHIQLMWRIMLSGGFGRTSSITMSAKTYNYFHPITSV